MMKHFFGIASEDESFYSSDFGLQDGGSVPENSHA